MKADLAKFGVMPMSCRTRKIRTMRSKASLSPARSTKVSLKRRSSEKAVAQAAHPVGAARTGDGTQKSLSIHQPKGRC